MASSSSNKSLLQDSCHEQAAVVVVEREALDQEDDDHQGWLQLGLGLGLGVGFDSRACKSSQQHKSSSNPLLHSAATQSISSSSCPIQFQAHHHHHHYHHHHKIGGGLGLELEEEDQVIRQFGVGFGNEGFRREIDLMQLQPSSNNNNNYNCHSLWANYHDNHENFASSSSCRPWHMESSHHGRFLGVYDDDDDHHHHHHDCRQMLVPNGCSYHDYCSSSSSNINKISTRPKSGLWFTLCASTNRREGEEKRLPQVPKAYIRVKDENVTVSMVKKYLVRKLGLSNEAEIEVYCMGQKLVHTQSLKQVRDGVWLPRLVESVNSAAGADERPAADCHHTLTYHLLSLHYGRPCL